VNEGTGAIRIAGLFANPGNILRPGGYARVRGLIRTQKDALLVPQRAVTELQGAYQVALLDKDDKISIQPVTLGESSGSSWIINSGLHPGDRIVAEGVQKVRPGMHVNPKPFAAAQNKGQ